MFEFIKDESFAKKLSFVLALALVAMFFVAVAGFSKAGDAESEAAYQVSRVKEAKKELEKCEAAYTEDEQAFIYDIRYLRTLKKETEEGKAALEKAKKQVEFATDSYNKTNAGLSKQVAAYVSATGAANE